ncbi:MAG TPA: hypothetical protein VMT67_13915 [Terriglobales bacterium]|nr:hypothetical protein [Terriglobales bacterium]
MKLSIILALALLVPGADAQENKFLESEMARIAVHTALLVPSQSVDEFPVWSADSRFLGVNIEGRWVKLDTRSAHLRQAKWHEQPIGAIAGKPELEPMSGEEAAEWGRRGQHGDSEVKGEGGFRAEIQRRELSSSLVLSRGERTTVIWKSDMENCGALSLSPNGSYLAYICELNGVFVMNVGRAPKTARTTHR